MSHSLALLHYPYLVYRGGQRKLWDPIRRQTLKVRPEERVRQRLLSCFIEENLYRKNRISTEAGLPSTDSKTRRTDILCYNRSLDPHLLVECKSEKVKISEDAAIQIARYNQQISAPFLLLTNGVTDHWYKIGKQSAESLKHPPDSFQLSPRQPELSYWVERGFLGRSTTDEINKNLSRILFRYWIRDEYRGGNNISYLSFRRHPEHLNLDHYYRVTQPGEQSDIRIALAFTPSHDAASHLVGIINSNKENIGFIDINITFLNRGKSENMWVYSSGEKKGFDAREKLSIAPDTEDWFTLLPDRLTNWYFDIYSKD